MSTCILYLCDLATSFTAHQFPAQAPTPVHSDLNRSSGVQLAFRSLLESLDPPVSGRSSWPDVRRAVALDERAAAVPSARQQALFEQLRAEAKMAENLEAYAGTAAAQLSADGSRDDDTALEDLRSEQAKLRSEYAKMEEKLRVMEARLQARGGNGGGDAGSSGAAAAAPRGKGRSSNGSGSSSATRAARPLAKGVGSVASSNGARLDGGSAADLVGSSSKHATTRGGSNGVRSR